MHGVFCLHQLDTRAERTEYSPVHTPRLRKGSMRIARHTFLKGIGAAAASVTMDTRTDAQSVQRVDVHHHFASPEWTAMLRAQNQFVPPWTRYSLNSDLEELIRTGTRAMLSVTTPGLWFGNAAAARRLARECNEYAAGLVRDHRAQFGFFVALPLPDVAGSLQEIAYGFDILKADGVGLFTSYEGKWLGDPSFDPVFEELNRRRAVVFVHPTTAPCCVNLQRGVSDATIEYGTDTTRAIAEMMISGASSRYKDVRIIFSHAGGTMPFLEGRFIHLLERYKKIAPDGFLAEARRFYYDVAQAAFPAPMAALLKVIPVSHVLFGTDYPYFGVTETVESLRACGVFSARDLAAIDHTNATALFD
jgi:predicted TIM-barrel fold metal-dependent hydrolase